jgi:cobalamin biosynthesis protein CobT
VAAKNGLSTVKENKMIPAKLRYEIRRLFENSGTEEFNINRKQGSLNVNALPHIGHSERLFKRRSEVAGIDSAVSIVLDCSGSMSNDDRMQHAIDVCYALLTTLSQAGVPTSVVTFSGVVSTLKPWNTPYQRVKPLLECVACSGGTNDYAALNFAHGMLLRRTEARKVCFVLTDGEGAPAATHDQCNAGSRLGITTIGIGIQENVSHVYPNAVRVNNLNDMGTVAFNKLKLAA